MNAVGSAAGLESSRPKVGEPMSRLAFIGVSALLFGASAAVTIVKGTSMSAMGEMPMAGGWTMSMVWMRMCGQSWPAATASFRNCARTGPRSDGLANG